MLHVYKAELNDSELIWEQKPPRPLKHQRVLVIVEDTLPAPEQNIAQVHHPQRYFLSDLTGRLAWQGDALHEQRTQRDAW